MNNMKMYLSGDNRTRYSRRLFSATVAVLLCGSIYGQLTTQGKDFWLTFGSNNGEYSSQVSLQVRIIAMKDVNVTFTFTATGVTQTIFLAAGTVYTKALTESEKDAVYLSYSGISKRSLHIESDENIAVYAINLLKHTSDATAIFPVPAYGQSYYNLSYKDNVGGSMAIAVLAIEDNTVVLENGIAYATLNRGETLAAYGMSGVRHLTTNKPVAYFTINPCTEIVTLACDCLYEQLLPETSWGLAYMIPVTIRGAERVRVYASQDNTTIKHTGGKIIEGSLILNRREYLELEISRSEAGCYIEADKPVAVTSFLTGTLHASLDYKDGDPAIAWIPAIHQFVKETTIAPFIAAGSSVLKEHHILVVTKTGGKRLTEVRVGKGEYAPLTGGTWLDHPSGYSFYSMPLSMADVSYSFRNPSKLIVLGYGLGLAESYYYLAGASLGRLKPSFYVNGIYHQDVEAKTFCDGKIEVIADVSYDMYPEAGHLRWFINEVEDLDIRDKFAWTANFDEGRYQISMISKDDNGKQDTVRTLLQVDSIRIMLSDTVVCQGSKMMLNVGNPVDNYTYRWFRDAGRMDTVVQSFEFATVADRDTVFYVEVSSNEGCRSYANLNLSVNPLPKLFVRDTSVCYNSVAMPVVSSPDAVTLHWYSDADRTDLISRTSSFVTAALQSDTLFYVEAVSENGCITRDDIMVAVNPLPELINLTSDVCFGSAAEISVSPSDEIAIIWYRDNLYSDKLGESSSIRMDAMQTDTVFYIEAISADNCVRRDSVKFTVVTPPSVVAMDDRQICYGKPVTLTTLQSEGSVSWNVDNETVRPVLTHQYIVTASRPPCPDATDTVTITVGTKLQIEPSELPLYRPKIEYGQQLTSNAQSPTFDIVVGSLPTGLSLNAKGWISNISDLDIPVGVYDSVLYFTVAVKDVFGCTVEQEYGLRIFVPKESVFVPRVFTPNGDGVNDYFMRGYRVIIFDRMGREIHSNDDGWDGTYNNKYVVQDVYFYFIPDLARTGYVGVIR
jgi:gliding motility-associated-like protein